MLGLAPGLAAPALAASYDVVDKDIGTLQADMAAGKVDSVGLVQAYQARIAAIDPLLHSVIALNPDAAAIAAGARPGRGTQGGASARAAAWHFPSS